MRTRSPGWRSSFSVGVLPFSSRPITNGYVLPPAMRSRFGRWRLLNDCQRLKTSIDESLEDLRQLPALEPADVLVDLTEAQRFGRLRDLGGLAPVERRALVRVGLDLRPRNQRLGDERLVLRRQLALCFGGVLGPFEPGFLPEHEARGLAAVVCRSVAPHALQMDGVLHPPDRTGARAGDVGALCDRERAAAVLQHLGHERKPVERSVRIQRGEDLRCAANPDEFPGLQAELRRGGRGNFKRCAHGLTTRRSGPNLRSAGARTGCAS